MKASIIHLIPLSMMFILLLMAYKTKHNGKLSIILLITSLMAAVTIATKNLMTVIPFMMVITLSGGLMILFLYITSSVTYYEYPTEQNKLPPKSWMMSFLLMSSMFTLSPNKNPPSPAIPTPDPSYKPFIIEMTYLTSMMMIILLVILMVMLLLCTKAHLPTNQNYMKPWTW